MTTYDVAIIGMGPVGSTAAILLADAGLKVVAFEQDLEVYPLPRAVAIDGEIVRGFQRVGRADEIVPLLQPVRKGDRAGFANSSREWLFGNDFRAFGSNGWQPLSMFDQPELDGYLRATACNHPNVTAKIGHRVLGFEKSNGQSVRSDRRTNRHVDVRASTIRDDGSADSPSEYQVSARYLLGCDGANSGVRRSLNVAWKDLGYDQDWLVVDVIAKEGHTLTQDTLQVCDPDRLATYIATKDPYRRWEFKLNSGETSEEMLEPEKIYQLIEPWTPRHTVEIRRAAVYQFHAATADRWRSGRVLLAGDAAHQTPPFLGQGMNAGMRDVINLAWKLPLVLSGVADPDLLDSYLAERGAHAEDLVDWAVAIGRLMEHLAAEEDAKRKGVEPPAGRKDQTSAGYGQGREAPPLRDGVVVRDQVSDTGSTGYLFSQPIVTDEQNSEIRLDDLLGRGFAIVAKSPRELEVNDHSRALISKLGIRTVTLDTLSLVRGHFDRAFEEPCAVIVRPDRYVFGHTSPDYSLDDLLDALAQHLCLLHSTDQSARH